MESLVVGDQPHRWVDVKRAPLKAEIRPVVALAVGVPTFGGALLGARLESALPGTILRSTFLSAAGAYLSLSVLDFLLHAKMEHEVTGRWTGFEVVPPGETVNHVLTVGTVLALLASLRPAPSRRTGRDWIALAAPAAFFVLGSRDELVYHRRRATHREDKLHAIAHLAAGVMLTAFTALRLQRA